MQNESTTNRRNGVWNERRVKTEIIAKLKSMGITTTPEIVQNYIDEHKSRNDVLFQTTLCLGTIWETLYSQNIACDLTDFAVERLTELVIDDLVKEGNLSGDPSFPEELEQTIYPDSFEDAFMKLVGHIRKKMKRGV